MKCPICGLINPDTALRCDCGYDFPSGQIKESYSDPGSSSDHGAFKLGKRGYFDGSASALFKKTEDGRVIFYPWGVLGSGYEIPTDQRYREIRQFVKLLRIPDQTGH